MNRKAHGGRQRYQATLVSHTHWDRAWYVPFQEYRVRLIRLVDRLLELLKSRQDYRVYMLDGQISVLEDYLEVRPERAAEIKELCRAERIQVGPWYVLADEFLVSPESLIRNLLTGHRLGIPYGGVMKIGYVPDGFGHIAQLPQILRGFGIDSAFFWRGMGNEGERLGTEFRWVAPDGSSVTAIFLPFGYHNVSNLGYPIHWGDTSQMVFKHDLAVKQIRSTINRLKSLANTSALLLLNGIDHVEPEPHLPEIIHSANEEIENTDIHHGTLAEHLARVRAFGASLPLYSGEFRWGRYSEILQGVYATRMYLKQANHAVEQLLERYVEPLCAFAWLTGAELPPGTNDLIQTAWRTAMKSHAHDDIYGAGVDQTHRETAYRFDQAAQLGRVLARDAVRSIARMADCSAAEGMPILVYNPLNHPREDVVIGEIDFDSDDPTANNFQIVDATGTVLPHQILDDREHVWMEVLKPNRKRRVRMALAVSVPPCGYRICYAQTRTSAFPDEAFEIHSRGARNVFLAFTITEDGGLDIEDLATGRRYEGVHHFHDVEDAGDEYSYAPCPESEIVTTAGKPATVSLVESGPCLVRFRVERTMSLPVGLSPDRTRRSEEITDLPIHSDITLYRGRPGLYIETEVLNRARDHKLSAVFDIDILAETVHVDGAFVVLERAIDLPDCKGWVEDPTPLMHQRAFTDLHGENHGFAILNRALPAMEVTRHGSSGTRLALTLLRAVGWLSRSDLRTRRVAAGPLVETPEAQCLGRHRFEYALLPHAGDWRAVYETAYAYNAPLFAVRADTHEGLELKHMNITGDDPNEVCEIPWPREGPNPDTISFVHVEPEELVVSALYRTSAGQGLIVRFFNVSKKAVEACITSWLPLREVWRTNMNEERLEALSLSTVHEVSLQVGGAGVVTLELVPRFG